MNIFKKIKEKKEKKFMEDYKKYKEKINSITNIEELDIKRIKLKVEKRRVGDPTTYLSTAISILAIAITISTVEKKSNDYEIVVGALLIILIGVAIRLGINTRNSRKNKELLLKSEIIQLRIEELKQEEIDRKREFELNKILNQENKVSISKIIKFIGIK